MRRTLRIGLAGLGTVGGALANMLKEHSTLKLVAVSARRERKIAQADFVADPLALATRNDIDVMVELIGGENAPAYDIVKTALTSGKHVVTANKALMARHGAELAALAESRSLALNFEAAIGAAIPIVRTLRDYVPAGAQKVSAILNGTCNYILCEMEASNRPLAPILAEAQAQGYAEAEPSLDIDGLDAAHKLCLIAAFAFGVAPAPDLVDTQGIRALTPLDMRLAAALGYTIRLIARAERDGKGVIQYVQPSLVPLGSRLAAVKGTRNALMIESPAAGALLLEGEGAGAEPTAYAVFADIMEIAADIIRPPFKIPAASLVSASVSAPAAQQICWFIRFLAKDEAGSIAAIASALAEESLSFARITQLAESVAKGVLPVAIMTHPASPASVASGLKKLERDGHLAGKPLVLPVEGEFDKNPP